MRYQIKGGYSLKKLGMFYKLIDITFEQNGTFHCGFQQNNALFVYSITAILYNKNILHFLVFDFECA